MKPMMRDSDKLQRGTVVVVGVGYDENSSFMQGPASAPSKIREMLHCGSANLCAENGIDLAEHPQFKDLGDIRTDEVVDVFNEIEDTVRMLVEKGLYILALGGDHSITFPMVRGYRHQHNRLNILQGLKVPIVGADIVELNPKRDPTGVSAMVAAKFLKEIAGKMIELNP
jgi:arginase family enzyme